MKIKCETCPFIPSGLRMILFTTKPKLNSIALILYSAKSSRTAKSALHRIPNLPAETTVHFPTPMQHYRRAANTNDVLPTFRQDLSLESGRRFT